MTVFELLTALLYGIAIFLMDLYNLQLFIKASISPQNISIIPDSYTYLLCLKLCCHNYLISTTYKVQLLGNILLMAINYIIALMVAFRNFINSTLIYFVCDTCITEVSADIMMEFLFNDLQQHAQD